MFPDIDPEDGRRSIRKRGILISRRKDSQTITFLNQPGPSGAKASSSSFLKFRLEGIERTEGGFQCSGQRSTGHTTHFRSHDLPEHIVIPGPAAVIADGHANILGDGIQV